MQDTHVALVALRHMNKDASKSAIYRGGGSIGISGQARAAFLVGFNPDDQTEDKNLRQRIFVPVKANLSIEAPALGYVIDSVTVKYGDLEIPTSRIQWQGIVNTDVEQVASPSRTPGPDREKREEAEAIIRSMLSDGPVRATKATQDLQNLGIPTSTWRRAKEELKVKSEKRGDSWYWLLPTHLASPTSDRGPHRTEPDFEMPPIVPGPPQEVETIHCEDYSAHQTKHRRDGAKWVCDTCQQKLN
jgi:hypothetical protein